MKEKTLNRAHLPLRKMHDCGDNASRGTPVLSQDTGACRVKVQPSGCSPSCVPCMGCVHSDEGVFFSLHTKGRCACQAVCGQGCICPEEATFPNLCKTLVELAVVMYYIVVLQKVSLRGCALTSAWHVVGAQ